MRICYATIEAKRESWPVKVGLGIVAEALKSGVSAAVPAVDSPIEFVRARAVHEWARKGVYRPETGNCDDLQEVVYTLRHGGDCEDWASVILAALFKNRLHGRIVAGGDSFDPYRHVWVEAWCDGRWYSLDAKGSQAGRDFDAVARWQSSEVIWSSIAVEGSGSEADPMIRSSADATRYMTPAQMQTYLGKVKGTQGQAAHLAVVQALQGGWHNRTRNQILAYIGQAINQAAGVIAAQTGASVAGAEAYTELLTPRTLGETNEIMVSVWVAKWRKENSEGMRRIAVELGVNPEADADKVAGALAAIIVDQVNAQGVFFDDWMDAHARGVAVQRAELLPAGSGSQASEIAGRLVRFARRVVWDNAARAIRSSCQFILSADKNAPWLSLYFLRPLGFHAQATLLREVGDAMLDGSTASFESVAVARSVAGTFKAAGQACLIAAPMLPPPWNAAAAAIGALSLAAGNIIDYQLDAALEKEGVRAGAVPGVVPVAQTDWQPLMDGWIWRAVMWSDGQVRPIAAYAVEGGWLVAQWYDGGAWLPLE